MMRVRSVNPVRRDKPSLSVVFLACLALLVFLANDVIAMQPPHKIKQPQQELERVATPAPAASETKSEEKKGDEKSLLHDALDRGYRFSKRMQSEFGVFGGDYLGDEWYNTWDAGGRYFLHLNNTFAVGGEYMYSPIRADSSGDFGKNLTTKHGHTIDAQLLISNDAAFRSGKSVIECDLMLSVGGGSMKIGSKWYWMGVIGGGLKIYTPLPWFAVRFDVNSYLHPTPKPTGDAFNADLVINLGTSFLFPIKKAKDDTGQEQQ